MSSSPTYLDPIVVPLIRGETVLDAACGYGRWGSLIRTNFWEAGLNAPPAVDGFDAFEPNLEMCRRGGNYRNVWTHKMPDAVTGKWDTVLACEIIEHLPEDQAYQTVEVLEQAARRRVIISTPNWRYLRGGSDTIVGYNEYEAHLSYIPRAFFRKRGYTVVGAGFGNPHSYFVRLLGRLRIPGQQALGALPLVIPAFGVSYVAYKDIA